MPRLFKLLQEIVSETVDYCFVPTRYPRRSWKRSPTCHIAQPSPQFYRIVQRVIFRDDSDLNLYRANVFQLGEAFACHHCEGNLVFTSKIRPIRLKFHLTGVPGIGGVATDANDLLKKPSGLIKLHLVANNNKIHFRLDVRSTNTFRPLTEVHVDNTKFEFEITAKNIFHPHIKSPKIICIKVNTEVVRLPRRFADRISPLESLDLDPTFQFPFACRAVRALEELLRWPKNLPKLRSHLPVIRNGLTPEMCEASAANFVHALESAKGSLVDFELSSIGDFGKIILFRTWTLAA